jgi:hypothetical protein
VYFTLISPGMRISFCDEVNSFTMSLQFVARYPNYHRKGGNATHSTSNSIVFDFVSFTENIGRLGASKSTEFRLLSRD